MGNKNRNNLRFDRSVNRGKGRWQMFLQILFWSESSWRPWSHEVAAAVKMIVGDGNSLMNLVGTGSQRRRQTQRTRDRLGSSRDKVTGSSKGVRLETLVGGVVWMTHILVWAKARWLRLCWFDVWDHRLLGASRKLAFQKAGRCPRQDTLHNSGKARRYTTPVAGACWLSIGSIIRASFVVPGPATLLPTRMSRTQRLCASLTRDCCCIHKFESSTCNQMRLFIFQFYNNNFFKL